jgi:hypothetical protein
MEQLQRSHAMSPPLQLMTPLSIAESQEEYQASNSSKCDLLMSADLTQQEVNHRQRLLEIH